MSGLAVALIIFAIAVCTAFGLIVADFGGAVAGFVLGVIAVGALTYVVHLGYSDPRDLTCKVESKDRAKDSDMRVYTEQCGVLRVQDLFWAGEFHSADTYAEIEPGRTYVFHLTGIRFGPTSTFPNVRSVREIKAMAI